MNVLPPFQHRLDENEEKKRAQQERWRLEQDEDLHKRRLADLAIRDYESEITKDAKIYATEEEEKKAIERMNAQKDAEFNKRQAEARRKQQKEDDEKVEWWETRSKFGEANVTRDRKHYADQLRRNESLKHNVEQLEEYEAKFRQKREADHLMRYRQFDHARAKV